MYKILIKITFRADFDVLTTSDILIQFNKFKILYVYKYKKESLLLLKSKLF